MRLDVPQPFVPFADGFPTPSGKLEFVSSGGGRRATTRCPATRRPADASGAHPLALIAPASHWFLNTMFANKPDLLRRAPAARGSLVHPDDAAARGLERRRRAPACSTPAASSRP